MPIIATLELHLRPERLDEARRVLRRALDETRAFDGNLGVDVLVDHADETHWIAYETWESVEHDAAYREFRAGPGAITALGELLAAAPVLTHFTIDEAV